MLLDFSASLHSARNDGCANRLRVISTVAERSLSHAYQPKSIIIDALHYLRDCFVVPPRNDEDRSVIRQLVPSSRP
jgi:hypothetical protein